MFAAPHGSVVFALSSRNYHSEFEHEKGVEKGITFTFSYFPYKRPIDQQPIRLSVDRWIDGCCSVGCSDCSAPTTIHQRADPSPSARTAGFFHSFFLYLPQLNLFNSMGFLEQTHTVPASLADPRPLHRLCFCGSSAVGLPFFLL